MSPTQRTDRARATPSPPRTTSASGHSAAPPKTAQTPDGQPLLNPVVRSKRTPIACTECRRRQVKCTGGSPQCERCEKRGVKCEYIPCSQQKASSSTPSTPPSVSEAHFLPQHLPPYYAGGHHARRSPTSWPHAGAAYQDYFPEGATAYEEHDHWHDQAYALSPSNMQVPQPFVGGAPAQSRTARPAYGGDDYNQATYSYQTYGQSASVHPTIPSHPGYSVGAFPSGYAAPDAHTGAADHSLSYGYVAGHGGHGRGAFQAHSPSQRSPYAGQYHQGGNTVYSAAGAGTLSDFTNPAWTTDTTYMQGAPYS